MPKAVKKRSPAAGLRTPLRQGAKRALSARIRGMGQLTSPAKVIQVERAYQVLEMRRHGHTYQEIADALDISPEVAAQAARGALSHTASVLMENTEEARQLEVDRIDAMLRRFQPLAETGNMAAASISMQLSRERRKLLALDKPEERAQGQTGVRIYVGVDIDQV